MAGDVVGAHRTSGCTGAAPHNDPPEQTAELARQRKRDANARHRARKKVGGATGSAGEAARCWCAAGAHPLPAPLSRSPATDPHSRRPLAPLLSCAGDGGPGTGHGSGAAGL